MSNKKPTSLVAQSNDILKHLTLFKIEERRLFSFCVKHFNPMPDGSNPEVIRASLDEFQEKFPALRNKKPNYIYQVTKRAINGIQQKPFEPAGEEAIWWFTGLKIKRGIIEIKLNSDIMPYFEKLVGNFIRYNLDHVVDFKKSNTWTMYEYLKEEHKSNNRQTWLVEVDDLKERFGVQDKYPRFADFYRRFIKAPLEEIEAKSDLIASCKRIKEGKAVVEMRFSCEYKTPKNSDLIVDIEATETSLEDFLLNEKISKKVASGLIQEAVKKDKIMEIVNNLPRIKKGMETKRINNKQGYLVNSIKTIIAGQRQQTLFETQEHQYSRDHESVKELEKASTTALQQLANTGNKWAKIILEERGVIT